MAGLFFMLGTLALFPRSVFAAALLFILGLVLIPPTWSLAARKFPKVLNGKTRTIGAIVILVTAIAATPPVEDGGQTAAVVTKPEPQKIVNQESSKQSIQDKKQELVSVEYVDTRYQISGTGLANTEYELKPSDSPNIKVRTDNNGTFKQDLPEAIQVFGAIELTRDTNGMWFGGKELYDTKYFALNPKQVIFSNDLPNPIILDNETQELTGYYTPKKQLLLKSGDTLLASTSVDKSGKFTFTDIDAEKNYMAISIYEKVSTGWFSSKEEKLSDNGYLEKDTVKLLPALPVVTKEESATESISFTSRTLQSSSLAKGQTKVTQEGSAGEKKKTYRVTYTGNDETKRELIKETIIKKPTEKIITIGTYVAPPKQKQPTPKQQKKTTTPKTSKPSASKPSTAPKQQAPQTSSNGRTGAECRDGTRSSATGRGACSHHGGVARWLY